MRQYGVRCRMADGGDTIITVNAPTVEAARGMVEQHKAMFYGPGDGAGRWLASQNPASTVVTVHEVKPLAEWEAA